jgi:poly-beta-1,6-N-acetyl-D-glucosamine synthase
MILVLIPIVIYVIIIALFFKGWKNIPVYKHCHPISGHIPVSVLIPFRNESQNLKALIRSLKNQSYPIHLSEFIFIDDHSSDTSRDEILNHWEPNFKLIRLSAEVNGKKAALLKGSEQVSGQLIITIDADCIFQKEWLLAMVSFYCKYNPVMIVAPVVLSPGKSFFSKFQNLEFLSLQGSAAGAISIGKPIMCNGANLAYSREILPLVQQTYLNSDVASGDDIFALLNVKKRYPRQVYFLKAYEAIAETQSCHSLKEFLSQRTRWTTKARYYRDFFIVFTAIIVLLVNVSLLYLFIEGLFSGNWLLFFGVLLAKSLVDFPFLYSLASFFQSKSILKWFPVIQCFYLFYVTITFASSLLGTYTWKNRKLRH